MRGKKVHFGEEEVQRKREPLRGRFTNGGEGRGRNGGGKEKKRKSDGSMFVLEKLADVELRLVKDGNVQSALFLHSEVMNNHSSVLRAKLGSSFREEEARGREGRKIITVEDAQEFLYWRFPPFPSRRRVGALAGAYLLPRLSRAQVVCKGDVFDRR